MIEAANDAGGKDNVTVVYIEKATESAGVLLVNTPRETDAGLILTGIIGLLLLLRGSSSIERATCPS